MKETKLLYRQYQHYIGINILSQINVHVCTVYSEIKIVLSKNLKKVIIVCQTI